MNKAGRITPPGGKSSYLTGIEIYNIPLLSTIVCLPATKVLDPAIPSAFRTLAGMGASISI